MLVDFKLLQVIAAQADFHVCVSPNIPYSAGEAKNDTPLLTPKRLEM